MITNDQIDPTKRAFQLLPPDLQIVLVDDDENEVNKNFHNVVNASEKFISSEDRSFILFDLNSIISQYIRIRSLMPRVYPFYAVKSMADKEIISLLGILGAGFDCASWDEIRNASLALPKPTGTFPEKMHQLNSEKIIFSHPLKFEKEMIAAAKIGVEFTVFDTETELRLIAKCWSDVKLLMRITPPKRYKAVAALGDKFGVDKCDIKKLICIAKELSLSLVGVSFHVGNEVSDMDSWPECVEYSAQVFRLMEESNYKPYLLDIGGGYPGISPVDTEVERETQKEFENMCHKINNLLNKHFPAFDGYVIICEPGTYFCKGSGYFFTQIIGKSENDSDADHVNVSGETYPKVKFSYVLNNSCFHTLEFNRDIDFYSLNDYKDKHQLISLQSGYLDNDKYDSRLLGYTVDEYDCIIPSLSLPELSVGDWLVAPDKGAYTDVHNDLPTLYCSTTSIPHYYCISKKYLSILKDHIRKYSTDNNTVLKSANRNDIFDSIGNLCLLM